MAMTIHVDIVSAETEIYSGPAEMVFAPGVMGELGIAPRHSPLITHMKPGEVRVREPGGNEEIFYVSGGILEVQPLVVTVLSDTGLRAHDIDEAKALEAKERAESRLSDQCTDLDCALAQAELERAMAQLRTLQSLRRQLKK